METCTNISVPDFIYRFYAEASQCIQGSTPEDVMADALTAYAGMLSPEIARMTKLSANAEVEL